MTNFKNKTKVELISEIQRLQKIIESDSDIKTAKKTVETFASTTDAGTRSSESRKAAEKLLENEERFRSIVENTDAGYFFIDNKGIIREVNNAWVRMYKYDSADEIVGKHFTVIQKADDVEKAKEFVNGIMKGKAEYLTGEFSRKCKDDSIGFHSFSARPVQQLGAVIGIEGFIIDITKRKIAEGELRKTRMLLKASIESPKDMIILSIDKNYRYLYFNKIHKEDMKNAYNIDVEIGMNILECVTSEDDRKKLKVHYDRVLSGESHSTIEEYGDINRTYYESFFNPIRNEQDEIIGISAFARNITERKKVEEMLIKEKEFTEIILNSQLDTFFVFEAATGTAIRWNKSFADISGYTNKEIAALKAPDSYHSSDDLKKAGVFMESVLLQGKGRIELSLICKDGHSVLTEYEVSVLKDEQGKPRYLISIGRDITERKKAEEALMESKNLLKKAQEIAHIGYFKFNPKTNVVEGSNELFAIFGLTREEFQFSDFIESVHPDEREFVAGTINSSIKNSTGFEIEHKLLLHDGTIKYLKTIGEPVIGVDDTITLMIVTVQDISKQKKIEKELIKSKELAEKYLDVAGNIILALDPNGTITLLNKKGHEIMGYKKGELIGKNWIELFIPKESLNTIKKVHKTNVEKKDEFLEYFEN